MSSKVTHVGAVIPLSGAVSQTRSNIASADLSLSEGVQPGFVAQAQRDAAVERFVRSYGLTFRGDIEEFLQMEAENLCQMGLFPSKEEAEKGILRAYRAFVKRMDQAEVQRVIAGFSDPQLAEAYVQVRIQEKLEELAKFEKGMDQAEQAVWDARQKWLGIHKKLQVYYGVDATLPDWRKRAESMKGLKGQERMCLKRLLREEEAALKALEMAEKDRDACDDKIDAVLEYLGGDPTTVDAELVEKNVAKEIKKFEMFLRACRGEFSLNIFVKISVEALQKKYSEILIRQIQNAHYLEETREGVSLAALALEQCEDEKSNFSGEDDRIEIISKIRDQEVADPQLMGTKRDGLMQTFSYEKMALLELEDECFELEKELRAIKRILGQFPLDNPDISKVRRQAMALEKVSDLEDEGQIQACIDQTSSELIDVVDTLRFVSRRLHEIEIGIDTMKVAQREILSRLRANISTFDHMIPLFLGDEAVTYTGPFKEDVTAFIALHKQIELAEHQKMRELTLYLGIDLDYREKCAILGIELDFDPSKEGVDALAERLSQIKEAQDVLVDLRTPREILQFSRESELALRAVGTALQKTAHLEGELDIEDLIHDIREYGNPDSLAFTAMLDSFALQLNIERAIIEERMVRL